MTPALSIIIATRNRAAFLRGCLDSLAAQAPDRWGAEVLVVDNASVDATGAVARAELAGGRLPMRLVAESRPGLGLARNAGVAAARGEAVIFLDDDAEPAPGWLETYDRLLRIERRPLVQGRILVRLLGARPKWLSDDLLPALSHLDCGPAPRALDGILFGANFGARREVLDAAGLFREDLGAGGSGFGEDTEFAFRAGAKGFPILYAPDACVAHLIPLGRVTRAAFLRRFYKSGASQALFRDYPDPAGRMLLHLGRTGAPRLLRGLFARDATGQVRELCALAEHAGRVAGIIKVRCRG